MSDIIPHTDPLMEHVKDVRGWTDDTPGFMRKGIRITFHNGLTLSAVQGQDIYSDSDSWEIAVIGSLNTDDTPRLMHIPEWGDTVCGWQTFPQVYAFAWRIVNEGRAIAG